MTFKIQYQKGEDNLRVSPTQAWRKVGWKGNEAPNPMAVAYEKAVLNLTPETEEDGIRAEAIRRLQVRQLSKARQDRTQPSSPLQSSTPETTASTSKGKKSMPK